MERVVLALVLIAVAVAVAFVLQRRTRPDEPTKGRNWAIPGQLHRPDFVHPDRPWLVAVFSSSTCDSCAATWKKVRAMDSARVAVQDITWQDDRALHERYGVEAVPTVLVADADGAVVASFVGQPPAAELWSAVADLRAADPPT